MAKAVKKASARKSASKKSATNSRKKAGGGNPRPHNWAFSDDDKIKFVGENNHREGSVAYQAVEVLKKATTVGSFKEKAEKFADRYKAQAILRDAIKANQVKITKAA